MTRVIPPDAGAGHSGVPSATIETPFPWQEYRLHKHLTQQPRRVQTTSLRRMKSILSATLKNQKAKYGHSSSRKKCIGYFIEAVKDKAINIKNS